MNKKSLTILLLVYRVVIVTLLLYSDVRPRRNGMGHHELLISMSTTPRKHIEYYTVCAWANIGVQSRRHGICLRETMADWTCVVIRLEILIFVWKQNKHTNTHTEPAHNANANHIECVFVSGIIQRIQPDAIFVVVVVVVVALVVPHTVSR